MRLVVILSVLVQIYANTGSAPWTRHGLLVVGPNPAATGRSIGPVVDEQRAGGPTEEKRPERNVYRTKLSKLRLILLADMLNEIRGLGLELDDGNRAGQKGGYNDFITQLPGVWSTGSARS
uniref:Uncharacterized protein n=1 Tax=Anopheles maculatus TaxID=74869 RepID=A0A182TCE4_9DIPT